jgi:hypothetical protein
MKAVPNSPRKPARLSASSENLLGSYALAATAAGVNLLALAQPAPADVVYTPAHTKINSGFATFTPLDLNNDGTPDFWFMKNYSHSSRSYLNLYRAPSQSSNAAIAGREHRYRFSPAALRYGAPIGSSQQFLKNGVSRMAYRDQGGSQFKGPWANLGEGFKHRCLGLKFQINGEPHFGWARLKIAIINNEMQAYITGYAYETVANQSLTAGQTKEAEETSLDAKPAGVNASTPEPRILGALALGSTGLSIWRRKESALEV